MCYESANPSIISCTISNNIAAWGGGIYVDSSHPTIKNCTFISNEGICVGGGMSCEYSNSKLTNCIFSGNSSDSASGGGGGIYDFSSNLTLINCIFSGNSAANGGGMFTSEGNPRLINCTFSGNSGRKKGGGVYNGIYSNLTLINCILWDNRYEEIYIDNDATIMVTYSNVYGEDTWPGFGNINEDPLFADPNNNDYHLKSQAGRWDPNLGTWTIDNVTSPCIDTGDPMYPIGHEPFPNGGRINMGAYGGTAEASKSYFGEPVCETIVAGDINGDCKVGFLDFRIMALHWLEER